jgi:hypothetical protein
MTEYPRGIDGWLLWTEGRVSKGAATQSSGVGHRGDEGSSVVGVVVEACLLAMVGLAQMRQQVFRPPQWYSQG